MGIPGLLPQLKAIQHERHISYYSNKRVAVDAYVWLHQIKHKCAIEIACHNDYRHFLKMVLSRIETFRRYNITTILVFDGDKLPAKEEKEIERENSRDRSFNKAKELLAAGNKAAASTLFGQALDVTPVMAYKAMRLAKEKGIECIVAPYEADAQLAYLSRTGYVDCIVTEDSDLLAFGAKCMLFKLDVNYVGQEIILEDMKNNPETSFQGWSTDMFLSCCIFAGCDYVHSLKSIGFKTAYGLMVMHGTPRKVLAQLLSDKKYNAPDDYKTKFEKAYLTFKFQRVFCPIKKELVSLIDWDIDDLRRNGLSLEEFIANGNKLPENDFDLSLLCKLWEMENLHFLGPKLSPNTAKGISNGELNPITKKPYEESDALASPLMLTTISGSSEKEQSKSGNGTFGNPFTSKDDSLLPNQSTLNLVPKIQGSESSENPGTSSYKTSTIYDRLQNQIKPTDRRKKKTGLMMNQQSIDGGYSSNSAYNLLSSINLDKEDPNLADFSDSPMNGGNRGPRGTLTEAKGQINNGNWSKYLQSRSQFQQDSSNSRFVLPSYSRKRINIGGETDSEPKAISFMDPMNPRTFSEAVLVIFRENALKS